MRMLFVNLPVRDLATAKAFYEALGFRPQDRSSDDGTAALVVDENIALLLHTRERFADLVAGEVGDPSHTTTVVNRPTVGSRGEVDDLVAKALAAGGSQGRPARDGESNYTGSFTDPDGNAWEITWLDQVHVVN